MIRFSQCISQNFWCWLILHTFKSIILKIHDCSIFPAMGSINKHFLRLKFIYTLLILNHTILPRDHISKKRSSLKNVSTQKSTQSENYFQEYDELIIVLKMNSSPRMSGVIPSPVYWPSASPVLASSHSIGTNRIGSFSCGNNKK